MNRTAFLSFTIGITLGVVCSVAADDVFRVGFFEGGDYPAHAEFRGFVREQLPGLAPAGITFSYPADGFQTAHWNRDESRRCAAMLAADTSIDVVLALGPWTVEDLLAAGFDRSIVADLRFDPVAEGLADSLGRPFAPNLTVRVRPGKAATDLGYLNQLKPLKRLGFLHFPSSDNDHTIDALRRLTQAAGIELVTAEGFDREGTYAFFKAFQQLGRSIDALYVSPLWGCDNTKIRSFFEQVAGAGIPVFSSEGAAQCVRGACACGSFEAMQTAALYASWKIARIAAGTPPSDLPDILPEQHGLTVNEQVARLVRVVVPSVRRPDVDVVSVSWPEETEHLTLVEAVQKALMQNHGYQARYEALASAAERAGQARAALLPQIRGAASLFHYDDNAVHNDDRYEADRVRVGLYLEQEIFSLADWRRKSAASVDRKLTELDQRAAALDLELAVTLAFLDCLKAEKALAQASYVNNYTRICRQIAALRDNLDLGAGADAIRWETAAIEAWQAEQRAQAELEIFRTLLNGLLGRPGDFPFVLDDQGLNDQSFFGDLTRTTALTSTPQEEAAFIARIVEMVRRANPEAQNAGQRVERGRLESRRNTAEFVPTFGLRGGLEYTNEWAEYPGFAEKNPSWYIGARIELPLFLGGTRFNERQSLKHDLGALQFQLDAATLEVANDARRHALVLLDRAYAYPTAARAADRAREYLDLVLTDYSVGARAITDLLDAVDDTRRTANVALADQTEYFAECARLLRLAGIAAYEHGHSPGQELLSRLSAPDSASH